MYVHVITALGVIKKMCIHTHTYVCTHTCITLLCVTACYCGRFSGIIISNWVDRFASMSSSSHIRASVLPLSLSWAQEKGRRSRACQVSIAIVRSPPYRTTHLIFHKNQVYCMTNFRYANLCYDITCNCISKCHESLSKVT